ncbi:TonB-dependent receptor [Gilvimarinus xylanilyticus]|uniref:TonB-dependent receptor n=1 Tax=Gilvimarinus xylanilyticus TaxID=2944139 RepID=A0A9X2KUP2_9GAMM|nr:TonB-dependent receptor [Gilvimarinus xylanilyticus]MCP8900539.1 TonB-dependent receptor [Gilvimarinus xylanilyticus]
MPTRLPHSLTALVIACIAPSLWAADLLVNVSDANSKRAVDNVEVVVTDRDNRQWRIQTQPDGRGRIENLDAGLYQVELMSEGYDRVRLPSVRLVEDKTTPVQVSMSVARTNLEEVLVLGNSIGSNWLSSVGASEKDREALRSSAGSGSDVLRALDGLPGLFADSQFSTYTVRGSGPRDNQILVDGIPFDSVVHFSDSFGELGDAEEGGRYSIFAPNVIDRASFQPGGWSSAYGGRAGSLLELDVARGNPDTPSYTARLDIAGLEVGYDGPSFVTDNTSVLFSARQLNFGRLFDLVGMNDAGEPEVTDIIFKTHTDFDSGNELEFLLIHAPEEYERTLEHVLNSDEDEPGNYQDVELVQQSTDNTLAAISYRQLLGDSAELTNRLYYRRFGEDSQVGEAYPSDVPPETAQDQIPRRFPIITASQDDTEIGWRLDFSADNNWGRFNTGLRLNQLELNLQRQIDGEWIRYEYEQSDFRPNPEQQYIVLTSDGVNTDYQKRGLQYAAFMEQAFSWNTWDARIGLRYEGDEFTNAEGVSPRVAASWQLTSNTSVSATAGRYLQRPEIKDLASNTSGAALGYETIDQMSLGFQYRFAPLWDIFVEPYYQQLSDLVVIADGVNQRFNNNGEGTSFGVDTAITRQFDNGWSASATYSYNDAVLKDSPSGPEYDADYHRPHSVSLGGTWEINQRWKLSGRWKWASGRPYGDYIIHDNVLGEGEPLRYSRETITNNTLRYDGYSSLNIRVDYRRAIGRTQVIAFVDIINLLGSENPSNIDFNERTGEISEEDGSLLPLVGLRFEW